MNLPAGGYIADIFFLKDLYNTLKYLKYLYKLQIELLNPSLFMSNFGKIRDMIKSLNHKI
ncbi:hypothetical protein EAE89_03035 [Photorhabdus heterorhabditis]|uniref:Uncharacterized protein n=1 Tax=Photorhabdus heterorhabditis TaxID=880156 RepID=A0ABR5KGH7_9GAMM|nr:hypothetical protein AM629_01180 [Photorhabdus heterorhabditis]MBS9440753.1 hypothetical protein [Photorhabdus heterorhabditis]